MTVSTLTNTVTYLGNGSATSFAVPFKVLDEDHLVVRRRVEATGEVDYTYAGTEYSYSGIGNDSGTLTLAGAALTSIYELVIERIVPYTQELDLVNAGGFYPDTVENQLDRTTMQIQQIATQSDDIETRALMVPPGDEAPSYSEFAAAFQGDPGGNIESVGLFTTLALGLTTIPTGTNRVRTSGHTEVGLGAADYTYDADVDTAYVTANPYTSFETATGRGFKLAEIVRTPYMWGCLGVRVGDTDLTMADDFIPMQAFADDARDPANRQFYYDCDGDWATSEIINFVYPYIQDDPAVHDHTRRKFRGGKFRPLPLTRQPGGTPMFAVLRIAGYQNHWDGMLVVSGLDATGECPTWANKRCEYCIEVVFASLSHFDNILVEGAKRDGIYFNPTSTPLTYRAGTDYEVEYPYSNNIGIRIDDLYARECGSHTWGSKHLFTKNWTAKVHGNVHPDTGVFAAVTAGFGGSTLQRTKLTFDSTAEFREGDYGRIRRQLLPATYTTVAADATAGTLTLAAGDPVTTGGLVVGDHIVPESGPNQGTMFEILSFGGTTNRTMTVSPKPVTQAAAAITLTAYTHPYQIMSIPSATEILVWPWMEDRAGAAGEWTHLQGFAANVRGPNNASVSFGSIKAINTAGGLVSSTLYSPQVSSMISEGSEFGIVSGQGYSFAHLGLVVDQYHFELCTYHIVQATAADACSVILKGKSALELNRCLGMNSKAAAGDALMPARAFNFLTLETGGEIMTVRQRASYSAPDSTGFTLSNRPGERETFKIMNGPLTCTLSFDRHIARLFGDHHWARVHWIGPGGAAPTGALTFSLDADLTHRGWAITGTNPISAPAKPGYGIVFFYHEGKKAELTWFSAD